METAKQMAQQEGLRYVNDAMPGIHRKKRGKIFCYYHSQGRHITDEKELARIRALAVPPAYRDVWICPYANGHIQATGIDERGRKQYRYHAHWREIRDQNKYAQILKFGAKLPHIRRQVRQHLSLPRLCRERVMATVVSLLEQTHIRVGNREYAKENHSYGLTTLRKKHVEIAGRTIRFEFIGKSGKRWNLSIKDRRIATVIKKCTDLPGQELFKYLDDDGTRKSVDSADVNAYLKEISNEDFTAKDFRTWAGTMLVARTLQTFEKFEEARQAKKNLVKAIKEVAMQLGNTPAICRKCYVHPEILNAYLGNTLAEIMEQKMERKLKREYPGLAEEEIRVLTLLRTSLPTL